MMNRKHIILLIIMITIIIIIAIINVPKIELKIEEEQYNIESEININCNDNLESITHKINGKYVKFPDNYTSEYNLVLLNNITKQYLTPEGMIYIKDLSLEQLNNSNICTDLPIIIYTKT